MRVMLHEDGLRPVARLLFLLIFVAGAFALTACSGRGGPVPYDPANFGRPDAESIAPSREEGPQRIGALDKLKISVFQVPELSGDYQVDTQGQIEFPLLGQVSAIGKTTDELKQILATRLSEKYLRNPSVQVALTEQTEQTITVDGSVKIPGVFPVRGTTTLMQAVALAKGTSEDANIHRVIIFRTVNGQRAAGAFDLAQIRKAQAVDPVVYGNDIIIVDGSRTQKLFKELMATIPLLGVLRPF